MKHILRLFILLLLTGSYLTGFGQDGFSGAIPFQAVARSADGTVLSNQNRTSKREHRPPLKQQRKEIFQKWEDLVLPGASSSSDHPNYFPMTSMTMSMDDGNFIETFSRQGLFIVYRCLTSWTNWTMSRVLAGKSSRELHLSKQKVGIYRYLRWG